MLFVNPNWTLTTLVLSCSFSQRFLPNDSNVRKVLHRACSILLFKDNVFWSEKNLAATGSSASPTHSSAVKYPFLNPSKDHLPNSANSSCQNELRSREIPSNPAFFERAFLTHVKWIHVVNNKVLGPSMQYSKGAGSEVIVIEVVLLNPTADFFLC